MQKRTVQVEAHCHQCGAAFYEGEQAFCKEDKDGSLIWFCEEHICQRLCHIVSASVEEESGAGDGAYDIFDRVGTPDDIGKAIADCLKESDLYSRRRPSAIDAGVDLYLTVRIKFCQP